jgi:MFS family permease
LIGPALGNLALGILADRKGYYQVLILSCIGAILALGVSIFVPNPGWMYLVFGLRGMSLGGFFLASLMTLEFCSETDRPTYIGINSTATGLMGMIAPMVGGWTAQYIGYTQMFALSAILTILGMVVVSIFVREPRRMARSSEQITQTTEISS